MLDREKVIETLESCVANPLHRKDDKYVISFDVRFVNTIIELLKEQEAVKPLSKVRHGAYPQIQHFCGNCHSMLHGKPKFCSECGRKVKWE